MAVESHASVSWTVGVRLRLRLRRSVGGCMDSGGVLVFCVVVAGLALLLVLGLVSPR